MSGTHKDSKSATCSNRVCGYTVYVLNTWWKFQCWWGTSLCIR